jgi:hypothetical protein
VPRFGDQLPSGAAPRARVAGRAGSAGVAGKVIDLVGTVVQQRKGAPDIIPAPASSTASGLLGGAAIPVLAAVAGPLASFAFSRIDRSIEVGAVERQQKREMAERAAQTLLAGRGLSSPADEVELCGDDEDGVASCEKVERFTDRATGRLMARRKDGKLYSDCERLPNGALACKRGTKKLIEVKKK